MCLSKEYKFLMTRPVAEIESRCHDKTKNRSENRRRVYGLPRDQLRSRYPLYDGLHHVFSGTSGRRTDAEETVPAAQTLRTAQALVEKRLCPMANRFRVRVHRQRHDLANSSLRDTSTRDRSLHPKRQ